MVYFYSRSQSSDPLACAVKVIMALWQYLRAWVSIRQYSKVIFSFLQIRNLVKKKFFVNES